MSSTGRAGLVGVAAERHSRRARFDSCLVHDLVMELDGGMGSA